MLGAWQVLKLKGDKGTSRTLKHKEALPLLMPNGPSTLGQVLEYTGIT